MSTNLDQFVQQMNRLANQYESLPTQIVTAAAQVYTNTIRATINSAAPGGKLRGVGKRGARVGARYDIKGATATIQATGPLHLLERDTKAHQIPRATRTRRARTRSGKLSYKRVDTGVVSDQRIPLHIGDRWVTGPVKHPGTKGKHPFERGVTAAQVPAANAAHAAQAVVLARLFQ